MCTCGAAPQAWETTEIQGLRGQGSGTWAELGGSITKVLP